MSRPVTFRWSDDEPLSVRGLHIPLAVRVPMPIPTPSDQPDNAAVPNTSPQQTFPRSSPASSPSSASPILSVRPFLPADVTPSVSATSTSSSTSSIVLPEHIDLTKVQTAPGQWKWADMLSKSVLLTCFILAMVGLALSLFLYYYLHQQELVSWRDTMALLCQSRFRAFQSFMTFSISSIRGVGAFGTTTIALQHRGGSVLSQSDFDTFNKFAPTSDFLDQIIFAPHVTAQDRLAWESYLGYNITTLAFVNGSIATPVENYTLQNYFPWTHFFPYTSQTAFETGLDTTAEPALLDYINSSVAVGGLFFSARVPLAFSAGGSAYGIVVTLPLLVNGTQSTSVFTPAVTSNTTFDERWSNLLGTVQALLRVGQLLTSAINTLEPKDMMVELFDDDEHLGFIARTNAPADNTTLVYGESIGINTTMGSRPYLMKCTPTERFINQGYTNVPVIVAVMAGVIFILNIAFVLGAAIFFAARKAVNNAAILQQTNAAKDLALSLLNQSQAAAEAHNASKSQFLGFLCHELRNPLHALGSILEFMTQNSTLMSKLDPEDVDGLSSMGEQIQLMASIVNDALDLQKIESGKMKVECVSFHLKKLCVSVFNGYKSKASSKGVQFILEVDDRIPHTLYSDPTRLRQTITNIVSNAIKFTPSGGTVTLRCILPTTKLSEQSELEKGYESLIIQRTTFPDMRVAETVTTTFTELNDAVVMGRAVTGDSATPLVRSLPNRNRQVSHSQDRADQKENRDDATPVCWVRLQVSDTGIGIAPDALPHLFQPFSQAKLSVVRTHGGTGLGLNIVRQIVDLMNGRIKLSSKQGSGTVITIDLPLRTSRPARMYDGESQTTDDKVTETRAGDSVNVPKLLLQDASDSDRENVQKQEQDQRDTAPATEPRSSNTPPPIEIKSVDPVVGTLSPSPPLLVEEERGDSSNAAVAPNHSPTGWPRPADGLSALLVDDSPLNLRILTRILEREGCQCLTATDGQEAVDMVKNMYTRAAEQTQLPLRHIPGIDCIFSDILMPVLDGLSACRQIREFEVAHGLEPMVMCAVSANAMVHEQQSSFEAGFSYHLAKPFSKKQIMSIIAQVKSRKGKIQ